MGLSAPSACITSNEGIQLIRRANPSLSGSGNRCKIGAGQIPATAVLLQKLQRTLSRVRRHYFQPFRVFLARPAMQTDVIPPDVLLAMRTANGLGRRTQMLKNRAYISAKIMAILDPTFDSI